VDIAVFPVVVVEVVLRHGSFRSVENRRLIHIVPNMEVFGRAWEVLQSEERLPPLPCGRVETVYPVGGARPTPAFVRLFALLIFHSKPFIVKLLTDVVTRLVLDVRINNSHELHNGQLRPEELVESFDYAYLPVSCSKLFLHPNRVLEGQFIPSEIFLRVRVL